MKMMECFAMPLTIEVRRDCCDEFESVVKDSRGDFMFVLPEDVDTSAVVHAINSHDGLVEDCQLHESRASYYQNEAYKYSEQLAASETREAELVAALTELIDNSEVGVGIIHHMGVNGFDKIMRLIERRGDTK